MCLDSIRLEATTEGGRLCGAKLVIEGSDAGGITLRTARRRSAQLGVIIVMETHDHSANETGRLPSTSVIFQVVAADLTGTRALMSLIRGVHFPNFSKFNSFPLSFHNYKGGQKNLLSTFLRN